MKIANGGETQSGGGGNNINLTIVAGAFGIQDEQIDSAIDAINHRVEFGNKELRTA